MLKMRGCLWLILLSWAGTIAAQDEQQAQRHHAYAFDNPELLSTQRTFGVGNATTLLGDACADFPEASKSYASWLQSNQTTLTAMTETLAIHYRIPLNADRLQARVAEVMRLKTSLDLTQATLDEVCPNLPETLALPNMNLEERYKESLVEVRDPNYLNPKRKLATKPEQAPATEETNDREEQNRPQ
jgi:hypothetical protein